MRLDGHTELPGDRVPGGYRIRMAQSVTWNSCLFVKPHTAF